MQGQNNEGVARWLLPVMAAAALVLTACAATKNNGQDVRLLQLGGLLQGHYDNSAQVQADLAAGRVPHQAVDVVIVQLDSLTVGEHAYYLEETDAHDPGRIVEQRVFSLESAKGGVLERVWDLVEPARWRGAASQPDLLAALQYKDLKQLLGCSLLWKKDEKSTKFTAANDMTLCHATPPAAHGAVYAKWQMEVTADSLSISEQAYDPDHNLLAGREDEPFVRLLRRAGN